MSSQSAIENPYRPGAGHFPPFFAGRQQSREWFGRVLRQGYITENALITGLRGFGKTVLVEVLRQMAEADGWLWVANDLSEAAALSEERLALRIITDLSSALSHVLDGAGAGRATASSTIEFSRSEGRQQSTFDALQGAYDRAPGLPSDKLKTVLARVGPLIGRARVKGIVFAYDEAQCLSDAAERNQFPLSMLIETIASMQKRPGAAPCLLVLSGLPQIFEALTNSRTYTERMFHVMELDRLSRDETFAAIATPLALMTPPLLCERQLVDKAVDLSGGYPYLVQFFGHELVDHLGNSGSQKGAASFPGPGVMERLDTGLFAARWNKTTDRQRQLLRRIAMRKRREGAEFGALDLVDENDSEITAAQAGQLLVALAERGLIYRTRHGRYAFTVPMSELMILRRLESERQVAESWEPADERRAKPKRTAGPRKRWGWFG